MDLHTHLFPPSHGALMLWGVDELLTYHYLIAEYFQTAPKCVRLSALPLRAAGRLFAVWLCCCWCRL